MGYIFNNSAVLLNNPQTPNTYKWIWSYLQIPSVKTKLLGHIHGTQFIAIADRKLHGQGTPLFEITNLVISIIERKAAVTSVF